MLTSDNLNETLADAVMDRPREFFIDNRRFCLWSPTLGMTMMLERHLAAVGIDSLLMAQNHSVEALRLASAKKKEVCDILAILSFRRFSHLTDTRRLSKRSVFFAKHLKYEELEQLILIAHSAPRI